MIDPIDMNVAGRLMLMLTQLGVRDARSLEIFRDAVCAAVWHKVGRQGRDDFDGVESLIDEQLALLHAAIVRRAQLAAETARDAAESIVATGAGMEGELPLPSDREPQVSERSARERRPPSGYVPTVKSMEEKLKDERKPVQTLLLEDCVAAGLLDAVKAGQLVAGMSGRTSQDAERGIVEYLRQVLQDQVKSFIRKAKGGPWSDPRTQESLRQDIHAACSVRSLLMLQRQVVKEYQIWEQEHGRGGILGLFSPRRRIVQR